MNEQLPDEALPVMSAYETQVWDALNKHWSKRAQRRRLVSRAGGVVSKGGEKAANAARRAGDAIPEKVKKPVRRMAEAVPEVDLPLKPVVDAAVSLLTLVNDWCLELNDPKAVEKLARKNGLEIASIQDLKGQDLKACDRLLARNTLKWRSFGALEGGGMGALAMVPVAGMPVSTTADLLVIQVLSVSIAARIAYSYGFDAKDPEEQEFISGLVRRSFATQAASAGSIREVAQAAHAIRGRQRWSEKLLNDHRIIEALEKLLRQLGGTGTRTPIKSVAKALPVVGILIGAGANSMVLGGVAADAKRFCQTRFLCEKYDLPLPAGLIKDVDEAAADDMSSMA